METPAEPTVYPITDGRQAVRIWTREQVTDMNREALAIVTDLDPPDDLRLEVFNCALRMIGQVDIKESDITRASSLRMIERSN